MTLLKTWFTIYSVIGLMVPFIATRPCFITNCPPGGKRSLQEQSADLVPRPCAACGPRGEGKCVGPHLCCGPTTGCYFKTKETKVCWLESLISPQCELTQNREDIVSCSLDGSFRDETMGNCVAENVCCSASQCKIDPKCQLNEANWKGSHKMLSNIDISGMQIPS